MPRKYEQFDHGCRMLGGIAPELLADVMQRYIETNTPTWLDEAFKGERNWGDVGVWNHFGTHLTIEPELFFADWYLNTPIDDPHREALDSRFLHMMKLIVERGLSDPSEETQKELKENLRVMSQLNLFEQGSILDSSARRFLTPLAEKTILPEQREFSSWLCRLLTPCFNKAADRDFVESLLLREDLGSEVCLSLTVAAMKMDCDAKVILPVLQKEWLAVAQEKNTQTLGYFSRILRLDSVMEDAALRYGAAQVCQAAEAAVPAEKQSWLRKTIQDFNNPDLTAYFDDNAPQPLSPAP